MPTDQRVTAALATTLVLWAGAFVAIRVALPAFSPPALSLARLTVASVVLAAVAGVRGIRAPAARDLPRIVAAGLCGMTAYQLLLNRGERTVLAGVASLLVATAPVAAALLARVFLGERLSRLSRVGVLLGFAGALVIALVQGGGLRLSPGALELLLAAAAQAGFFVLQKPLLTTYSPLEVTCYAMWAGTLACLPLLPALVTDLPRADTREWVAVGVLGVGCSAAGFLAWAYAQARVSVTVTTNTLNLVPFLAIALGYVLLRETVHPLALLGGVLALAGVAANRVGTRGDRPAGRRP